MGGDCRRHTGQQLKINQQTSEKHKLKQDQRTHRQTSWNKVEKNIKRNNWKIILRNRSKSIEQNIWERVETSGKQWRHQLKQHRRNS